MATIDYEAEYNNRARVPEHAEIFARWMHEAENYRADRLKAGRAELGLSYGDTPRQFVDLFLPDAGEAAPVAIFIHGGWWRSLDPSMFSHMARGPNVRGVAVAVAGYDLCPNVAIADIIEQIPSRLRVFMAAIWPPSIGLRTFGRRPSRRGNGRQRLALALPQGAGRPSAGRLFGFGGVRSFPTSRHQRKPGSAARRRGSAQSLAGILAATAGAHVRCGRRRARNRANSSAKAGSSRRLGRVRRRPATKRSPV